MVQSVSKTVKNEAKEKSGFLSFVLGTLGASLLEHLATGKGGKAEIPRYEVIRTDEGKIKAGQNLQCRPIH